MSEMESYQVCVGPVDQGGPDDIVVVVQAEDERDACYRAGIIAVTERGLAVADYIVKSCVTQAEFMADQGVSRVRPYLDEQADTYAGPTEQQLMDWNIHDDHDDHAGDLEELEEYYSG